MTWIWLVTSSKTTDQTCTPGALQILSLIHNPNLPYHTSIITVTSSRCLASSNKPLALTAASTYIQSPNFTGSILFTNSETALLLIQTKTRYSKLILFTCPTSWKLWACTSWHASSSHLWKAFFPILKLFLPIFDQSRSSYCLFWM